SPSRLSCGATRECGRCTTTAPTIRRRSPATTRWSSKSATASRSWPCSAARSPRTASSPKPRWTSCSRGCAGAPAAGRTPSRCRGPSTTRRSPATFCARAGRGCRARFWSRCSGATVRSPTRCSATRAASATSAATSAVACTRARSTGSSSTSGRPVPTTCCGAARRPACTCTSHSVPNSRAGSTGIDLEPQHSGDRIADVRLSDLALEHASEHWGTAVAVADASSSAPAGAFVVLLGPSGCGKSTTLRMIAGLDTPSSGRILIDGRDVTRLPPAQRRIAMVFQSYALFPHLSVRENILFGVKVRKEPARDHERRLARVAELLGLSQLLARKPAQLSGGQQQRVALGRAIIAETSVCLMDEPLSNLDAQLRHEMRREIRALQQKLGITMVYVTHDQTEAMSMADQVVLLNAGRIEQDAAPAELYARPATLFAAR